MLRMTQLDPVVSIQDQIAQDGPDSVILFNTFTMAPEDVDAMLRAWADDAAHFKAQPGFICAQLHRGIGDSNTFLNYAVWQTVAHFRAAFNHPGFMATLIAYPESVVASPHLFRKVAMDGICVA